MTNECEIKCPKCGSKNVMPTEYMEDDIPRVVYLCKDCRHCW